MDGHKKCQKMEMPLKWKNVLTHSSNCAIFFRICYPFQWHFHIFWYFVCLSILQTPPLSISLTLGLSIHFIDTSSTFFFNVNQYSGNYMDQIMFDHKLPEAMYFKAHLYLKKK